jgi:AcrR family transcriptional regulator
VSHVMAVTPTTETTSVPAGAPPSGAAPTGDMALRILAATAVCVAADGLRATSIDDIAEAAGCARATIYRLFPGGRAGLLAAAAELQIASVLEAAGAAADAEHDLADSVTAAVHAASTTLAGHTALQRLLAEEPGAVLPFISFDRLGPLLAQAASWGAQHFRRFLTDDEAEIAGEWVARVVLVHLRSPGSPTDTTDRAAVHRIVEEFLLPGLVPLDSPRPASAPSR